MKITVEFDNLQDLNEFLNGVLVAPGLAGESRKETSAQAIEEAKQEAQEAPKQTKAKKSTPKAEKAPEEAPAKAEEAPEKEEAPAKSQAHTEGDLKLLLSEKLKAGKKAEVKKLFESYGVSCLTDLIAGQKDNLDEVYAKAEVI